MNKNEIDQAAWGGILLAGGRSSRMGQEKGLVEYRGQAMAQYAAEALTEVCGKVVVVAHDPRYSQLGLSVVGDDFPGLGPIAGMHRGMAFLLELRDFAAFVVLPCDMPDITVAHLRYLMTHFEPGMTALVARADGRVHPLVGIYTPVCLPLLRAACLEGRPRLMDFLKEVSAAILDFPAEMAGPAFRNINTPEELEA
jgi:molybdopterin-guanine dinucleotide biosynthesis protein A